jgi:NAD(P)H dehydrogenase (quinone)
MQKTVLLIHAHPEPTSLTRTLVEVAKTSLLASGHRVLESDLYAMNWKAVFDAADFPQRVNEDRLCFVSESGNAYAKRAQTQDVEDEQAKLRQADAIVFQFPIWWFSFPAILKGWVDRVFAYGLAYGYKDAGNQHRYGEGGFAGKRALLSVTVGGPFEDYGARGINGSLEQILFPITHGTLFFSGMEVLPTFAVYGTGRLSEAETGLAIEGLNNRLDGLFTDAPIPFRAQNSGDYQDKHQLAAEIAPGRTGIVAHHAEPDLFV